MTARRIVNNKYKNMLLFIAWLAYFAGYVSRLNYGAVMAEIIAAEHVSKGAAGLISTGAFTVYAIGQIVSGVLGDQYSPRRIVFFGLLLTGLCNLAMPFCSTPSGWLPIWCLNGFAQAMLWPPMLRIFAESYTKEALPKMCVRVSTSTTVGTIAVYVLAPFCITFAGWRMIFYVSSSLAFLVAVVWIVCASAAEKHRIAYGEMEIVSEKKEEKSVKVSFRSIVQTGVGLMAVGVIMHGFLRDSITTWMPTFMMENYEIGSAVAILSTVILPIFNTASLYFASFLNNRWIRNEAKTATILFASGFVAMIFMFLSAGSSAGVSLLCAAVITSAMYGVNLMLVTAVPTHFASDGKASTITGILNAFTYLGSAISIYGIGKVSEQGWQGTLWIWIFCAGLGTCLLLLSIKKWTAFMQAHKSAK